MRKSIEMSCAYGDEVKRLQLIQAQGGPESFQILIDNYYKGNLFFNGIKWVGHLNKTADFTTDDIQILGDIIDNCQN